jgi:tape measure domain-containing protein
MASKLTVRLGLDPSGFNKSLKQARRSLNKFSKQTREIGSSLTRSLTVPLGGLGIAAIKSAADFEKLEKQLTSVTGSVDKSREQIARLKKIAEAPGLGFEQAVSASARLQAVGLNAEQAEKSIAEFGNAVARSGGGAQEFDGAILALTQIASKGKISAEEINQLNERIFEIRPALKNAFGTANSEELQKLGITSEEFIAKVTEEFAKLDRVQGGLANAFENLTIGVKSFLADIGGVITELFPVQQIVSRITDGLTRLAERFKGLDAPSQRLIIILGGIAAAIGPVILAVSSIASGLAVLASPIALTVAAIAGLAAIFVTAYQKSEVFRDTVQVIGLVLKTIVVNAFELLGSAIRTVVNLFGLNNKTLKNSSNSFKEFGASSVVTIDGVINAIKLLFKAFTFGPRLVNALGRSLADAFIKVRQFIKTGNTSLLGDIGKGFIDNLENTFKGEGINRFFDKVERDVKSAQKRINAARFKASIETPVVTGGGGDTAAAPTSAGGAVAGAGVSSAGGGFVDVAAAEADRLEVLKVALQRAYDQTILGSSAIKQDITEIGVQSQTTGDLVASSFERVSTVLSESINKTTALQKAQQLYNKSLSVNQVIADKLGSTFDAVFNAVAEGKNAFKALSQGIKQIVIDLIKAAAKAAIFAVITSIIVPGGAGFASLFKSGFSALSGLPIGKAASGGIVPNSQILNVGEQGAEAIIPLDRINEFTKAQELQVRIEGTELVALLKNSEDTYNRMF